MHLYGVHILYPWLGSREGKGKIQGEAGALLQDSSIPPPKPQPPMTWEGFLCEVGEGDPSMYTSL